ncbi:hypothetical protein MRX96_009700 [Rhipicephalus microplus]
MPRKYVSSPTGTEVGTRNSRMKPPAPAATFLGEFGKVCTQLASPQRYMSHTPLCRSHRLQPRRWRWPSLPQKEKPRLEGE